MFQTRRSHLIIPGLVMMPCSKSQTQDPQKLDVTVPKFSRPGHPALGICPFKRDSQHCAMLHVNINTVPTSLRLKILFAFDTNIDFVIGT